MSFLSVPRVARSRHSSVSSIDNDSMERNGWEHASSHQTLLSPQVLDSRQGSLNTIVPGLKKRASNDASPTSSIRYHGFIDRLEESWAVEVILVLCSLICMILIVIFLSIHNDQPFASWTFYFSLNTVVSILGAVFRSTLLMAVSAALAQGKWIWFRKRASPISTFKAIDDGSRETIGSFKLLWHMRGQHLVSAGAVVIALGFLVDPFLQAVISDYGRLWSAGSTATIAKAERFDIGTQCVTPNPSSKNASVSTTPDFDISAAFFDGLSAATGSDDRNVSFHCASGNCTWDEFVSLAICSSCFDITKRLKLQADPATALLPTYGHGVSAYEAPSTTSTSALVPTDLTTTLSSTYSLENLNLKLSNTNGLLSVNGSNQGRILESKVVVDQCNTVNFQNSQTFLAAFVTIRAKDGYAQGVSSWPGVGATALECGLSLCLNLYRSNVSKGVLYESVMETSSRKVNNSWLPLPAADQAYLGINSIPGDAGTLDWNPIYHDRFLYRTPFQLDPSLLNGSNIKGPFNVTQKAILSTMDFLKSLISEAGDNSWVKVVVSSAAAKPEFEYGSPVLQSFHDSTDLSKTFEKLAKSLSGAVRSLGTQPMEGATWQWAIHYKVRWGFLALPVSLVTIGAIFLALSILESHRIGAPAWRSNSIATMVHGPDEVLRAQLRSLSHAQSLKEAGTVEARLEGSILDAALTAISQMGADVVRPRTPSRDEESLEMSSLSPAISSPPRTGSTDETVVEQEDRPRRESSAASSISLPSEPGESRQISSAEDTTQPVSRA